MHDGRGLELVLVSGKRLPCDPVPEFLLQMARAGGLMDSLKQRLAQGRVPGMAQPTLHSMPQVTANPLGTGHV